MSDKWRNVPVPEVRLHEGHVFCPERLDMFEGMMTLSLGGIGGPGDGGLGHNWIE